MKKKVLLFFSLLGLAFAAGCGNLDNSIWTAPPAEPASAVAAAAPVLLNLTPGVFSGVGSGGFYGDIYVEVEVNAEGSMSRIDVTYHSETPSFAYPTFEQLIPLMIAGQSTDIDIVSGATMTSVALINAVNDALGHPDTGALGPPSGLNFTAGTYTASAMGYIDTITVSVEFDADRIASIHVTAHDETPVFFDRVVPALLDTIIEAQTTDVPNISGATATSQAIRDAVESAVQQAAN